MITSRVGEGGREGGREGRRAYLVGSSKNKIEGEARAAHTTESLRFSPLLSPLTVSPPARMPPILRRRKGGREGGKEGGRGGRCQKRRGGM